ncbi:MAG: hypothetical protein UT24_C0004G0059 [Candidatus Woesebacteria bacterium GW2011_GWB1_39_12]|uniref:TNase-like domain-containing protein n=2 Tax=Candidatus Woeseibacteriota TaxID=1752722 RepID=A0A0G0Q9P7_9BACT|nr:MAG: hypothetical protein UT23_C0003G0063 [Candidatus Woesebacteria bacterium GW2011_GWA1_39_12]KKR01496.1 MAG: hypothetical protein UT24_C0004G0059 [Candidatus Woesebacteria bacterium GW2011_GWB1_39_12]
MLRGKHLLIGSLLLNLIFIFILTYKAQKPTLKELSDENEISELIKDENNNAQVIGAEEEIDLQKVIKVIDGDTIVLENSETVRYIGIDTPEVSQGRECFSKESTEKNIELVLGKEIRLKKDVSERDRYGRLLRYVYVGDTFINETLVRDGFAFSYTYPPDVKYSELFKEAEKDARENKRGLWGKCNESLRISPSLREEKTDGSANSSQNLNLDLNCSSNSYNCTDFKTQAEAQSVFESCGGTSNDIHKLDRDGDGRVCETLP